MGADPTIQVKSNEKAKYDAAGHGKADLHEDRQVLYPTLVLFVIQPHGAE
jgi:hypothetical protein